jgi:hypothetical protein
MAGGSNGYRAALVRLQLTPGLISSLPRKAGLPPFISFSTSYRELDSAVRRTMRRIGNGSSSDNTRPLDCTGGSAVSPSKSFAPRTISSARPRPTSSGRRSVAPPPGFTPTPTSGWPSRVFSRDAKRMSQARTKAMPIKTPDPRFRNYPYHYSDNLTPQETTEQDSPDTGPDGAGLSCPGSSVVAEESVDRSSHLRPDQ